MFQKLYLMILTFYQLAIKHADTVAGGGASAGALLYLSNSTLYIRTGFAAEKNLDADMTNGTISITLT